jgi:proline racemase
MNINRIFTSIDTHTGGNPTRTITGGLPHIPGKTVADKMLYLKENMDWVRTALMFEPRGHSVMSGVILTEPCHPEADIGTVFIETSGYLPMCGHDTIGVATALVETGMVKVEEPTTRINLDTPAGLARVRVDVKDGKARSVTFRNIPSFAFALDTEVDVEPYGTLTLDVAYGGNVYAILPAEAVGIEIRPENADQFIRAGRVIRNAVNAQVEIRHPEFDFIDECTHVEFFGPPSTPDAHTQNTVFLGDSGIDRSPCGTGTSAKLAVMHARGEIDLNDEFVHESIIGSRFRAKAVEAAQVGPYSAIIPEVTGSAHLTGMHQWFIDPDDPLKDGFLLG